MKLELSTFFLKSILYFILELHLQNVWTTSEYWDILAIDRTVAPSTGSYNGDDSSKWVIWHDS